MHKKTSYKTSPSSKLSKSIAKKFEKIIKKIWRANIEGKCFTTTDYIKFMNDIINVNIKQKELVNKSEISRFINISGLDKKIKAFPTKEESKVEQDKLNKLKSYNSKPTQVTLINNESQNFLIFQSTFITFKIPAGIADTIFEWRFEGLLKKKIRPRFTANRTLFAKLICANNSRIR